MKNYSIVWFDFWQMVKYYTSNPICDWQWKYRSYKDRMPQIIWKERKKNNKTRTKDWYQLDVWSYRCIFEGISFDHLNHEWAFVHIPIIKCSDATNAICIPTTSKTIVENLVTNLIRNFKFDESFIPLAESYAKAITINKSETFTVLCKYKTNNNNNQIWKSNANVNRISINDARHWFCYYSTLVESRRLLLFLLLLQFFPLFLRFDECSMRLIEFVRKHRFKNKKTIFSKSVREGTLLKMRRRKKRLLNGRFQKHAMHSLGILETIFSSPFSSFRLILVLCALVKLHFEHFCSAIKSIASKMSESSSFIFRLNVMPIGLLHHCSHLNALPFAYRQR